MLLRALVYNIEVRYMQGSRMFLTDTLSKAYLSGDKEVHEDFERVNALTYITLPDHSVGELRQKTNEDEDTQMYY